MKIIAIVALALFTLTACGDHTVNARRGETVTVHCP